MSPESNTSKRLAESFHLAGGVGRETEKAATRFYGDFRDVLTGYVRYKLRTRADEWEDALHNIIVDAWEHRRTAPHAEEDFRKWLFTIARNVCVNMAFRRAKPDSLSEISVADPGPGTVTKVHRAGESRRLWAAIDSLEAPLSEVVRLRHDEQLGVEEIAERLGTNRREVHRRMVRAQAKLAVILTA